MTEREIVILGGQLGMDRCDQYAHRPCFSKDDRMWKVELRVPAFETVAIILNFLSPTLSIHNIEVVLPLSMLSKDEAETTVLRLLARAKSLCPQPQPA